MRALLLTAILVFAAPSRWVVQFTGVESNLRGVAIVVHPTGTTIWASGNGGVVLRSADSGQSWQRQAIPGGEALDFRGLQAFEGGTVYLMASGEGKKSRIYKTRDAGKSWELQYFDPRESFFLDALACFDATHCFALSDPVEGKFLLLRTEDGKHWKELPRDHMPDALPKEGAFAASNSSLRVYEKHELYFGTGGPAARVFHSADDGLTWTARETPILSGKPSQGIFSVVRAGETVVVTGGDYAEPNRAEKNAAYSLDRGATWHLAANLPGGYRSAVENTGGEFVAVGPSGAELSHDGIHWKRIDSPNLNALSINGSSGWAVGPHGSVAEYLDQPN